MKRQYFEPIEAVNIILILLVIALLALGGYAIYGRYTQEHVETFSVVDKEIDSGVNCVPTGKTVICTPYTHHIIYSESEKYYIDPESYDSVIVGKTHSFHIIGWDWDKYIDEVLE